MLRIETELRGVREVNAAGLQDLTGRGWVLICAFQETIWTTTEVRKTCPGGGEDYSKKCRHGVYGGSCGAVDYDQEPGSVTVTKYLVGAPEENLIEEKQNEIDRLVGALDDALVKESQTRTVSEKIAEARDTLAAQLDQARGDEAEANRLRTEAEVLVRKLEEALHEERNKVRKLTEALSKKVTG